MSAIHRAGSAGGSRSILGYCVGFAGVSLGKPKRVPRFRRPWPPTSLASAVAVARRAAMSKTDGIDRIIIGEKRCQEPFPSDSLRGRPRAGRPTPGRIAWSRGRSTRRCRRADFGGAVVTPPVPLGSPRFSRRSQSFGIVIGQGHNTA